MKRGVPHATGDIPVSRHRIGATNIDVFPVALGTATFGWTLGPGPSAEILDAFVDLGGNLIDTADSYASGVSEHIIGTWLGHRGIRDKVVVATKVGRGDEYPGLSAESIRKAVDASLERLHTDYIDLLYFHAPDASIPLVESLSAVEELILAGKVRALGASNFPPEALIEARINASTGLPRIEACALELSLLRQDIVGEYDPLLAGQNVSLMPYFVLANGYLGNLRDVRPDDETDSRHRRAAQYAHRRGAHVLRVLDEVAKSYGSTASAVAVAWCLQHTGVGAAAVGVDSVAQLEELMRAPALPLSRTQVSALAEG